jgi:hypothetical protein
MPKSGVTIAYVPAGGVITVDPHGRALFIDLPNGEAKMITARDIAATLGIGREGIELAEQAIMTSLSKVGK